jgi:hypothetical protein
MIVVGFEEQGLRHRAHDAKAQVLILKNRAGETFPTPECPRHYNPDPLATGGPSKNMPRPCSAGKIFPEIEGEQPHVSMDWLKHGRSILKNGAS